MLTTAVTFSHLRYTAAMLPLTYTGRLLFYPPFTQLNFRLHNHYPLKGVQ